MRYMRGDQGKRVDMRYDLKGRTQGRRDGMQTWSRNVKTRDGVIQTRWMRDKHRCGTIQRAWMRDVNFCVVVRIITNSW